MDNKPGYSGCTRIPLPFFRLTVVLGTLIKSKSVLVVRTQLSVGCEWLKVPFLVSKILEISVFRIAYFEEHLNLQIIWI